MENLFKKNILQDLLSSLNSVISTNESTRIITGHVIYNPAYTYKFQLKTTFFIVDSQSNPNSKKRSDYHIQNQLTHTSHDEKTLNLCTCMHNASSSDFQFRFYFQFYPIELSIIRVVWLKTNRIEDHLALETCFRVEISWFFGNTSTGQRTLCESPEIWTEQKRSLIFWYVELIM